MISFIVPYKNLLQTRREIIVEYFYMMKKILKEHKQLECIVSDYGSIDGIEEFLNDFERIRYIYTEPNENHFLNIPKCLNHGASKARNSIICPTGPDLRFDINLIIKALTFFNVFGKIILRVQCYQLDQKKNIKNVTFAPYFLHKENIIKAGGWDERMYGWGKEEDDLIERIHRYQKVLEIIVRGIGMYHVWHSDDFRKKYNTPGNWNTKIMWENINTNGKNLVNSYW